MKTSTKLTAMLALAACVGLSGCQDGLRDNLRNGEYDQVSTWTPAPVTPDDEKVLPDWLP